MTQAAALFSRLPALLSRTRFYYGWVVVGLAALAMVGTLPGRTQGLGLITESLLKDLQLDRVTFAEMNLWATLLGSFAAIAWLARSEWFNTAFGFPAYELAPSFLLFGLLSGAVMFWFSPLGNILSRKHEYEADAFAREAMGGAGPLVGALRKLSQKNLSNLTPHPWFSGFYYSHPTLVEREAALTKAKAA